jgi:hypothetical protein
MIEQPALSTLSKHGSEACLLNVLRQIIRFGLPCAAKRHAHCSHTR